MKMQKYSKIFHLAILHSLRNYKSLIGLSIFLITCLLIFAHIWKIATARSGGIALSSDALLWYIGLNEWVLIALPGIHDEMELDLRSGRLAYLLPRPISYLGSVFFEGLGILCANLFVLGVVTFSFVWLKTGVFPFTLSTFCITLGIGLTAGVVGLIFQMLVGISAFWMHHVDPFHWLFEKLLITLGGLMLPLAVYPVWLQKIANLTPFPAILGERSALFIHNFSGVLQMLSLLVFWGVIGLCTLTLLYKRGLKIVNIEGG